MLFFGIPEIGCDLSLMKVSYNLTKRTTKTEKFEKCLKMYIINLKIKGCNLTKSVGGNIIISILSYKPKRLVSYLRLPKEQEQANTAITGKTIEREKCRKH